MPDMTLRTAPQAAPLIVTGLAADTPAARRLQALGFRPGTRAHILGRAPFGDPILIALANIRLALRADEAALVLVTTASPAGDI